MAIGCNSPRATERLRVGASSGRPSTEASVALNAAGAIAADASRRLVGFALLAAEGQYDQESVEAKRSDVSSPHGAPGSVCHQLAPPSVATSAERVGSSSRKKSTW